MQVPFLKNVLDFHGTQFQTKQLISFKDGTQILYFRGHYNRIMCPKGIGDVGDILVSTLKDVRTSVLTSVQNLC